MARGRMISKTLGTSSEKFARLRIEHPDIGLLAQALYPLLVANSDDFGRQKGDAFTVKHSVWSTAPDDQATFERALEAIRSVGLIVRYTVDGSCYLEIVQFDAHQQGLHRRTESQFPDPPGNSGNMTEASGNSGNIGNPQEIPSEANLTEPKRTEPKRKEPRAGAREDESVLLERFESFWSRYPRHEQRALALEEWLAMAPSAAVAEKILASVAAWRLTAGWQKAIATRDLTYVKLAKNWLSERLWQETPASGVPTTAPTTCKHRHDPPCTGDEAACTARYLAELRGADRLSAEAVPA
jgi:hypothetical protein